MYVVQGGKAMLDEVIFFQTRIFRIFCDKAKLSAHDANMIFDQYGIWKYLEDAYDVLHINGDECALDDVIAILKEKGVNI